MRKEKKWMFYCDFCKKKGMSGSHISIHEKHCTANPDRDCRLCGRTGFRMYKRAGIREIIDKYRKYFYTRKIKPRHPFDADDVQVVYRKKFTLQEIMDEVDECPNCIFTIIRCLGLNRYYFKKKFDYDYKEALKDWWGGVNEEAHRQDERETYEIY